MGERDSKHHKAAVGLNELVDGWVKLVDMGEEAAISRIVETLQLDSYSKPDRGQVREFVTKHLLAPKPEKSNGRR